MLGFLILTNTLIAENTCAYISFHFNFHEVLKRALHMKPMVGLNVDSALQCSAEEK